MARDFIPDATGDKLGRLGALGMFVAATATAVAAFAAVAGWTHVTRRAILAAIATGFGGFLVMWAGFFWDNWHYHREQRGV